MFRKYINKSMFMGIIIGIMLSTSVLAESKALNAFYNDIKVSVNNKIIELKDAKGNKVEPFIVDSTTYLPVRVLAESLGMEVKYNETTNTVELSGKEETKLMSEVNTMNTTTIIPTVVNTYNEDDLVITEVNGEKYIEIKYIFAVIRKAKYILHSENFNCNIINSENKVIATIPEYFNGINNDYLNYFPNSKTTYIKYSDYQNIIKPLLGE